MFPNFKELESKFDELILAMKSIANDLRELKDEFLRSDNTKIEITKFERDHII